VARRNRLAREYSQLAHERRQAAEAMMERDAAAQRFARDIMENAPGIAYLMLSGDMRALVLYANQSTQEVVGATPAALLGRCVGEVGVVVGWWKCRQSNAWPGLD
jgi:PAS domain-containing protein